MTRRSTRASKVWATVGLAIAVVHLATLTGISLFDDGSLSPLWLERLPWLLFAAAPAAIAVGGLRHPPALATAAVVSLPLSLMSLAGATLPLLLPAVCYALGYASSFEPQAEA